eukprot:3228747-Amphidinium_carterae.1
MKQGAMPPSQPARSDPMWSSGILEGDDAAPPTSRKLPLQEKSARQRQLANRLPGLQLDDEMEPAHALIDRFAAMTDHTVTDDHSISYVGIHESIAAKTSCLALNV